MSSSSPVVVTSAVEGLVDEAVARKLTALAGATPGAVYGRKGKPDLLSKLQGYNAASKHAPWLVLVDLDGDAECAPTAKKQWLPAPGRKMCFRIAVRQVETWLLADRGRMAEFLSVALSRLPEWPELETNAKQTLVNVARRSRKKSIRQSLVPSVEGRRQEGPEYTTQLIEFVNDYWRPGIARRRSQSLDRAMTCLQNLSND